MIIFSEVSYIDQVFLLCLFPMVTSIFILTTNVHKVKIHDDHAPDFVIL